MVTKTSWFTKSSYDISCQHNRGGVLQDGVLSSKSRTEEQNWRAHGVQQITSPHIPSTSKATVFHSIIKLDLQREKYQHRETINRVRSLPSASYMLVVTKTCEPNHALVLSSITIPTPTSLRTEGGPSSPVSYLQKRLLPFLVLRHIMSAVIASGRQSLQGASYIGKGPEPRRPSLVSACGKSRHDIQYGLFTIATTDAATRLFANEPSHNLATGNVWKTQASPSS